MVMLILVFRINFSYPNYSLIQTPRHNLQTKWVRITEDALYKDLYIVNIENPQLASFHIFVYIIS